MKRLSRSERFHRFLLQLLPFDFRREYGSEMEDIFRQQQKHIKSAGERFAFTKLLLKTMAGILAESRSVATTFRRFAIDFGPNRFAQRRPKRSDRGHA